MYTLRSPIGFITVANPDWWWLPRMLCWANCETISGPHWTGNDQRGRYVKGRVVEWGPVCPTDTPDTFLILLLPLSLFFLHLPSPTPSILVLPRISPPSFPLIFTQPATVPGWFHLHPQQPYMLMSSSSSVFLWSLPKSIWARWDTRPPLASPWHA